MHFIKTKKFFRELISNFSDAYDKIRYELLKNAEVPIEQKEHKIDILSYKENKRVSITNAGIEMTTTQLISNLDTIERS
jgi:molecular chaperone HtpG